MLNVSAGCWYSIFMDAYTYSTNYLIFTITVIITSIVFLWIYEKPQFYKSLKHLSVDDDLEIDAVGLIFKRSKPSNIISPIESNEELETNYNTTLLDEIPNNQEEKKIPEVVDPEPESS